MFTKSKITQSMIDAVNSVISEGKEKLLLEPELDETGFHKAAHAAKKANQTHFEFQGKKYPVTAKSHAEAVAMEEEKSEKVHTSTGMKVYGHRYGNAAKAHRDQTKHELDKMKGPKEKDLKEEGDCVTKPEAKDIAKKEVKGHEKKMHHAEEMTLAHKWKEKAKAKIKENKGSGPQETFTDNNMGEEVRKSDVPAYLRKAKGEKPLTVADVKGPKKDTISHPENLAKARNEEVVTEGIEVKKEYDDKKEAEHGVYHKGKKIGYIVHDKKHDIHTAYHSPSSYDDDGHAEDYSEIDDFHKHHHAVAQIKASAGINESYVTEAEVTTPAKSPDDVTTDMIRGREKGGNANEFKSYKLQLKTDGEMKAPPLKDAEETAARKSIKAKEPHVDLPNLVPEEKNWIAGAIKKPGAETAAAHKAGMSTQAYAQKHKHDAGKAGKRARLAITLKNIHKEETEVDQQINEVLSKDASAGDWIHDFVHSDNPKFAGKSKAERKKMALGAYYAKQNEEAGEGAWYKETPWKKSPGKEGVVTDKSGAKHTPMSRAKDLARSAFKKLKNETMMGKISN